MSQARDNVVVLGYQTALDLFGSAPPWVKACALGAEVPSGGHH